ncbi:hypothetical protein VTN77DRAFT_5353 [Rasamsonia byssochlamydoides]|uniref:uncharacterized protein n=1 Tax=Rasamsonia byssochlamydoides TaxID=89139 RepID=UPI003743CA97
MHRTDLIAKNPQLPLPSRLKPDLLQHPLTAPILGVAEPKHGLDTHLLSRIRQQTDASLRGVTLPALLGQNRKADIRRQIRVWRLALHQRHGADGRALGQWRIGIRFARDEVYAVLIPRKVGVHARFQEPSRFLRRVDARPPAGVDEVVCVPELSQKGAVRGRVGLEVRDVKVLGRDGECGRESSIGACSMMNQSTGGREREGCK